MKASKLISILAQHVCEHGDYEVVIPTDIEDFLEELEDGIRCSHCGYDGYFIMEHHIDCPNKNKPEGGEAP